ncbi:RnfABCDGE type electron transport complex subunit D [Pseudomonadota bacterium]
MGRKFTVRRAAIAPHLRAPTSFARVQRWQLFALLPVMLASVYMVGQQYFLAIYAIRKTVPGWRTDLITSGVVEPDQFTLFFIWTGLVHIVPVVVLAYLTGFVWEHLFARLRGRVREGGLLPIALVFTALLPPAVPLWHVVLGMSCAIVLGKEVFGGHGKTFLPPALVGIAILQVSYPATLTDHPLWVMTSGYSGTAAFSQIVVHGLGVVSWPDVSVVETLFGQVQGSLGTSPVLACLLGLAVLLAGRVANWRVVAGVVLGVAGVALLSDFDLNVHWHFMLGSLTFVTVFIATDPASTPATNAGRWLHGILAGAMVVLIRVYHPNHPDGVVPAFLFASVMAPMIDAAIIRLQVRWARVQAKRRRDAL